MSPSAPAVSPEVLPLLAHALHSIHDAVTIADPQDRLIYVNPAFSQLYGYTPEEVLGQPSSILWADPNAAKTSQIWSDTLGSGWTGELKNRRKDGREITIHLTTSHVKDAAGRVIALIGVARDISDRVAAEAQLQSQREEIQAQTAQLAATNDNFQQHLTYARGLQRALMASSESLERFFPDSFVLQEASGPLPSDFFWVDTYLDRIFVAVTDIHTEGMAGALLSLLIQSMLVQAVHEDTRLQPDGMIELIQERLLRNLPVSPDQLQFDGVSLGIASISRNLRSCIYGGADVHAHVLRKGSFMVMEGIAQRLGLVDSPLSEPPHVLGLSLQPGDMLYFYTRGAFDMVNARGEVLGQERLHALLHKVSQYPMIQQQMVLNTTLRDWRQCAPLASDLLLLAIRI